MFRHRPERSSGQKKSWYLVSDDEDLPAGEVVTCGMPLGSLLLIKQLIPHRSTENFWEKIRWSVDLRWQRLMGCTRRSILGRSRTSRNTD